MTTTSTLSPDSTRAASATTRAARDAPRIPMNLHPDRLFPADPATRALARRLYDAVKNLPIVSPHGHTDPRWFADDAPFPDAARCCIVPDHYVFRMLYSQGVPLEELGVPRARRRPGRDGSRARSGGRFAAHYHLFRGTPTRMWLDHAFHDGVRHRRAADAGIGRPHLRPHHDVPRDAGVPAARAVRALQHRGASRPPNRRSIRSRITRRSARRAGRAAS